MPPRLLRAAVAAALALACTACSAAGPQEAPAVAVAPPSAAVADGAPEPAPSPDEPEPPAAPAVATVAPPQFLGEEATFSEMGALDFAGYFLRAMEYTRITLDPALLRSVSSDDCDFCFNEALQADADRAAGLQVENFRLHFDEAVLQHFDPDRGEAEVLLTMEWDNWQSHDPQTLTAVEVPAGTLTSMIYMRWVEGRWIVHGIE